MVRIRAVNTMNVSLVNIVMIYMTTRTTYGSEQRFLPHQDLRVESKSEPFLFHSIITLMKKYKNGNKPKNI